jgi:hypothetical protein
MQQNCTWERSSSGLLHSEYHYWLHNKPAERSSSGLLRSEYHYWLHNKPAECNSHLLCSRRLKSWELNLVVRWTYLAALYRSFLVLFPPSTAALPNRQPVTAGACCDQRNDKRSTSMSWHFLVSFVLPCRYTTTKWILCTVQGLIAFGQLHFTLQGVVILTMKGHPLFNNDIYTRTKENNNNKKTHVFSASL